MKANFYFKIKPKLKKLECSLREMRNIFIDAKSYKAKRDTLKQKLQENLSLIKCILFCPKVYFNRDELLTLIKQYVPSAEIAKKDLYDILKFSKQIHAWLTSNEFKEKYLDTNHPYPPLINPAKLNDENEKPNYHTIPAKLAWKLNLPLPSNYLCYFLSASWSAHDATLDMFRCCGVQSVWHHNADNASLFSQTYALINDKSIKTQNKLVFFILYARAHLEHTKPLMQKYFSLTYEPSKTIVCLVRDPISRLKSAINNAWNKELLRLTLEDDVSETLRNRTYYWTERANDFMKQIDGFCNFDVFAMNSLLEMMGQNLKVIYVNFDEVLPQNAFKTFEKLSTNLHFSVPCKESFPNEVKHNLASKFLPIEILFKENIIILIDLNYHKIKWVDITNLLYKEFKYKNLGLFVENEHIKDKITSDKGLLVELKDYFERFFKAFEAQLEFEKSRHISEEDVLEYFRHNPFVAGKLKKILDKELTHLKVHRPDIVASWKFYNEFERIFEN